MKNDYYYNIGQWIGRIILLLLLGGVIFYIYSEREENQKEKINKEQIKKSSQKKVDESTKNMIDNYNAIADWDLQLIGGGKELIGSTLTVELEKVWINEERPILFNGYIFDLKNKDQDNYILIVQNKYLTNNKIINLDDFRLSLSASKTLIDTFLKEHPNLLNNNFSSFTEEIIVIGRISSIESIDVLGSDCSTKVVKIGNGALIDLVYLGKIQLE